MKNLKKKNNKGFSLVELIVVVMIMAILAVALAPQVMKWVGNSRTAADVSTYETLVSSVQLALADETTYSRVVGATGTSAITVTISTSGVSFSPTIVTTSPYNTSYYLDQQLQTILGADYASKTKAKVASASYVITVDAGKVSKSTPPDASTVK